MTMQEQTSNTKSVIASIRASIVLDFINNLVKRELKSEAMALVQPNSLSQTKPIKSIRALIATLLYILGNHEL